MHTIHRIAQNYDAIHVNQDKSRESLQFVAFVPRKNEIQLVMVRNNSSINERKLKEVNMSKINFSLNSTSYKSFVTVFKIN